MQVLSNVAVLILQVSGILLITLSDDYPSLVNVVTLCILGAVVLIWLTLMMLTSYEEPMEQVTVFL